MKLSSWLGLNEVSHRIHGRLRRGACGPGSNGLAREVIAAEQTIAREGGAIMSIRFVALSRLRVLGVLPRASACRGSAIVPVAAVAYADTSAAETRSDLLL